MATDEWPLPSNHLEREVVATQDQWRNVSFGDLLAEPVRNGIYKPKPFHGQGLRIVNMGEQFAHPRLKEVWI